MATQLVVIHIGPHHRSQRIPAHQGAHPAFHEDIAGDRHFVFGRNGIEVRGIEVGTADALFLSLVGDGVKQPGSPLRAFALDDGFQGF